MLPKNKSFRIIVNTLKTSAAPSPADPHGSQTITALEGEGDKFPSLEVKYQGNKAFFVMADKKPSPGKKITTTHNIHGFSDMEPEEPRTPTQSLKR